MLSISKRRNLLGGLAAILLLTSSMTVASVAVSHAATQREALDAYFKTGLNYCAAQSLAAYWQVDVGQAKVTAGQKILLGNTSTLRTVLRMAKKQHPCTSSFNLDDTKSVADLWTMGSVSAS